MTFSEAFKFMYADPKIMMYMEPKGSGYFLYEDTNGQFLLTPSVIMADWGICERYDVEGNERDLKEFLSE